MRDNLAMRRAVLEMSKHNIRPRADFRAKKLIKVETLIQDLDEVPSFASYGQLRCSLPLRVDAPTSALSPHESHWRRFAFVDEEAQIGDQRRPRLHLAPDAPAHVLAMLPLQGCLHELNR